MEQILYSLPDGWNWHKLKELTTKIGSGATPKGGDKAYKPSGISLIRSLNVHDRFFKEDRLAFIDNEQADALKNVIVESGDVLLNITGASIARCCIVPDEFLPARVNQHVTIIRPTNKVNSKFLNYLIVNPKFKAQLLWQGAGGSTRQALTKAMVEELDIPLPSLPEQKRIVEKLDALLTRIDTAIEHLQESITLTDSMFVSGMDKAFNPLSLPPNETGLYELPKEWVWQNLGSISTIGTGVTPLKGRADYYNNGHINWVTSKATGDDFVSDSEQKITEVALSECRLKLFPVGTLIVALYGQGKTRGQVSELLIESTINQALAAVVVNPDHNSKFVKYFLKRSYLLLRSKASGGTQENLNLSIIKAIQVPLPDTQQQRKIVLSLDALNDQINQVKIELTLKIELLNQLKASILDSAFKGEL